MNNSECLTGCADKWQCALRGLRIQILLTVENGEVVQRQLLRPDEMAMSLACFTELAARAGWTVIPPDAHTEE
ncbi:hypothetical protein M942_09360 [Enterobacter ludwigii]|jgi:hypothetical protein|uniref:hypothetical protein n=1 Tax=Enterobacter TaxID=547 RepID=UPI0003D92351|nr:hypothetical protein [Enterobacter ludwigii]AHE72825.1 hypothetical protein M942_09360 [Enterobacter ludwigii]KLP45181.1 hypothetical protein ABR36_04790 [Enterobacter ludwigii]HDR2587503.1 hypothetical protein [Enterobacter ludwigii]HDR2598947.1 hypothetical protein [Enterobacter ludwigii]